MGLSDKKRVVCEKCGHGGAGENPPYNCDKCGGFQSMVQPSLRRHTLSHQWRTVLTKLAEYGDLGVDHDVFVDLVGGGELVRHNIAKVTLDQMFFEGVGYWERVPDCRSMIRITRVGREALK